jgi:hypothetical protein
LVLRDTVFSVLPSLDAPPARLPTSTQSAGTDDPAAQSLSRRTLYAACAAARAVKQ